MDIAVKKAELSGVVMAPSSKSYAHRMLIAASLASEESCIYGNFSSEDIEVTINALRSLGAKITIKEGFIVVTPVWNNIPKKAVIDAAESGSTLRFMLVIASALGVETTFVGRGRLPARPIDDLLSVLASHGITASANHLPLTIKGKLTGGEYIINGAVSSQYITGLLLALPLVKSAITVTGAIVSQSYINITLQVLKQYGIDIQTSHNRYLYNGGSYKAAANVSVPLDWSGAAFFAVGAAICGLVTLKGLAYPSCQGDSAIIQLLKNMRAKVVNTGGDVTVYKSDLRAIDCDISDCPDIAPILAIAMAASVGVSKMSGVERLRHKESDRLQAIIAMLTAFKIKCWESEGSLYIDGGKLVASAIDGAKDHRIVMSAIIGASVASGTTTISDVEAIDKSYKNFIEDYKNIGGRCDVIIK